MKQYDKIYYPDKAYGTFEVKDIDLEFPECNASQRSNVIVLTIEEAKNMWERAVELFYGHDVPNVKEQTDEDFTIYLTSKGINHEPDNK